MKNTSNNPVIRYLQMHAWEWLSAAEVGDGTAIPVSTIEEQLNRPGNKKFMETRTIGETVEYRFIGQQRSCRRRIVEYLNVRYPDWLTSSQIAKGIEFDAHSVGQTIKSYEYRMPVEHRKGWHQRNEYRYIPNDTRSLIEDARTEVAA